MHNKTIAELAAGLKAGEYSSEELAQAYLARIKALDGQLNSFITVTEEQALAQARAADALIAAGKAGPITGVWSTLKSPEWIKIP